LCLALDDRPLFLTEATRLLFTQLSPASRRVLAVPGTATTQRAFLAAYRRVRYCFGQILKVAGPSALPKNRRLTAGELKARTRPMTPDQVTAARGRLEALVNALLEASVSVLTENERAASGGCTGLDATPVPLFSRGPSRRAGLCASDPDGGWYVREGDHRGREDGKGKPLRKICWALEATIATTARPPGAPPATPNLAIGLAMARPGEDPGGTGARVLASAAARGHKTSWLGYDRAYTAALPDRFHLPARALGYSPVMDYRADQPGIQASTGGTLLVEGTWYCPALPEPLITATARLRDHAIDRTLYDQQIAARTPYQLKRKDGPDTDGYQRLSCPALGTHPGLMCPLREASLSPRDGRPKVLQPPEEPPKICRQTAITIAPDTGARYRQDLPYGSPARQARYATLRNTIEGLNGYAKDTAHQALAQPGRRRVRGIAAQSLFTRPQPAGPPADDAQAGWRQPRRFDAGPRLCQASARTPEADRLVVALAAVRIPEHVPRRVQEFLRQPDRRDDVRRGARDQFWPQQAHLILVLPLDLGRFGARHHAEHVVPGDAGRYGVSWITPMGAGGRSGSSRLAAGRVGLVHDDLCK